MTDPTITTIAAGAGLLAKLASLATAIAKGASEAERLTQLAEFQKITISTNFDLVTLQQANQALTKEKSDLERQIMDMERWDTESQRYQLHSSVGGGLLYAVKESMKGAEPAHYLCPKCFQDRKKSILNGATDPNGWTVLRCPSCKTDIQTRQQGPATFDYAK